MESKQSSKLNIAILHPDLGIGGAERLVVDAAVELASQGHKVHIFTAHHDKNRCFEETVDLNVRSIEFIGTFPVTVYGSFLPRHVFYRFHAVCAYIRCLFVALGLLFLWPSFDVILADQVSVVIFYCHFPDLLLAQHTTTLRRLYRKPIDFVEEITTGMADMILVNSKFTASMFARTFRHLHSKGIRPAVLYPAVNLDQFDKKNIELAISAFAKLHTVNELTDNELKDASLTVAGGYDERLRENVEYLEELRRLAEREGVSDRVKFVTSCSTAERNTLLSECLIVPLEAMAAHKPVIACNSGGPVETIRDGVTGFLCEPIPQDFSSAMAKFLEDPQVAKHMGAEARKHVADSFSTRIFGQRLNQYVTSIGGCSKQD
ncbi:Alpha-1,3/1,6-mannosyltransferase ALG2 [Linum perenne]